ARAFGPDGRDARRPDHGEGRPPHADAARKLGAGGKGQPPKYVAPYVVLRTRRVPSAPRFGPPELPETRSKVEVIIMYDAIVVGARCAGSPTAMLLASKGYRVLVVDKGHFPSDIMSTHFIHQPSIARLARWGLLEEVQASNCPPVSRVKMDVGP